MANEIDRIELISESKFYRIARTVSITFQYLFLLILVVFIETAIIDKAIIEISTILITIIAFVLLYFFYVYRINKSRKRVEVYCKELMIRVSDYSRRNSNELFIPLVNVNWVEKKLPSIYYFSFITEKNKNEIVHFNSNDLDFKFLIPFLAFTSPNSNVIYFKDMVNYAKKLQPL